jgi:hypothetical protein
MIRATSQQSTSPFMRTLDTQTPFERGNNNASLHDVSQEVFTKAGLKDVVARSSWTVQATTYMPKDLRIPSFMEYISLRTNILADNESKLLTMPWLGDDEPKEGPQEALVHQLPKKYEIKHDINAHLDLRNAQCRFYSDTVDAFLADVSIRWNMVLYWLLSPDTSLKRINRNSERHGNFESVLLKRSAYEKEMFRRDDKDKTATLFVRGPGQWQDLLCQLQEPSAGQLRVTVLACAALFAACNFNPWYLAKQSKAMQDFINSKIKVAEAAPNSTFRGIVCRVCHE